MSDRIHELIIGIGENVSRIREQLSAERSKNEEFQVEISKLKSENEANLAEISSLQSKIVDLKNSGETSNEQIVNGTKDVISDEQIDEMVKEIEYCITQLKR